MGPDQRIQFLTTRRKERIAYATVGEGPAIVRTPPWLGHLDFEWQLPAIRDFYQSLAQARTVIRYDSLGCGLSDWSRADFSFAAELGLLEEVVDALGLRDFALFGHDAGALLAIAYSARHPERVSDLVLYGVPDISKKRRFDQDLPECFQALIRDHWQLASRLLANLHASDVDGATLQALAELIYYSSTGSNALEAIRQLIYEADVSESLSRLRTRTAVIHRIKDCISPYDSARELSARVPASWLLPLQGRCHLPYFGDSAPVLEAIARFLGGSSPSPLEKVAVASRSSTVEPQDEAIFRCEGEYWTVGYRDNPCRIKDSQGMRYIARLLQQPNHEFHARELETRSLSGELPGAAAERTDADVTVEDRGSRDAADIGEMLDARAKSAYRRRLQELRAGLEQAKSAGNVARASELEGEISFLARELSRAVGLGGRDRRAGSTAERARLNVTRAIHRAIQRITEYEPAFGDLLRSRIRTGLLCVYRENQGSTINWKL